MLTKAVILSAGKGTRLLPLTTTLPKVMLPVNGKPLLLRHIEWLKSYGITEFFLNVHYLPQTITGFFGDGERFGVRIHYNHEPALRGTAGSIVAFRQYLNDSFVVHYGDVYSEIDIARMYAQHRDSGASATLAVHPSSHPEDSDIAETDANSRILRLHSKPGSARFGNLGNAGCYIAEPVTLNYIPDIQEPDFIRDVFPPMLDDGLVLSAYSAIGQFTFDMGTHARYNALKARLGDQASPSRHDLSHHPAMNIGQPELSALKSEG